MSVILLTKVSAREIPPAITRLSKMVSALEHRLSPFLYLILTFREHLIRAINRTPEWLVDHHPIIMYTRLNLIMDLRH